MKTIGIPDPVKARYFAEIAHSGQTYNDEVPYTFHLEQVAKVGEKFHLTDPAMVCVFYLHDTIEDTNRSYNDIKKRFGEFVAETVYAVSSELGRNREERNAKTYPKIRASGPATMAKLCDRIANFEYGMASGGKTDMYLKEYPKFRESIYNPEHFADYPALKALWDYVDKLMGHKEKK